MALSAGEFVLPSFGGDPGQALSNLTNRLYMRNMQQQRLELQKEAKRQQSGQFLERFLDPKQYLSGTAFDPMIVSSINEALQKGAEMAEQGADIPTMLMGLGQYTNRINDYSNKAKLVNKQVDDTIEKLKQTGAKGYDYAAMKDQALRQAFHSFDPKTGQDMGLQDISKVDPSRNYVMETLQQRPDLVTNASDIDEFAKNAPKMETSIDNTTVGPNFRTYKHKVGFTGQNYLQPEYDQHGQYQASVPRYEEATDAGKKLTHLFTDANGQTTEAPVRLLAPDVFNDLVQRKGVGDYIRGQVLKHLREYQSPDGKPIDLHSPQANMVARAIAYDELKNRAYGGIKEVNQEGRPPAAEVNLHYYGDDETRAYNKRYGRGEAEYDLGQQGMLPKKKGTNPKTNTVDALNEVASNNPDYLEGVPEEYDGRAVIDVTNQLPKAQLKYGPSKIQSYKNVYYDPEEGSFTLIKQGKNVQPEVIQKKDIPRFLHSVATANGVDNAYVGKSLGAYGFKNGQYTGAGEAPDLRGAISEHRNQLVDEALSKESETERSNALKTANIKIPEGTVTGVSEKGGFKQMWGVAPYYLQYIKPNGQKGEKPFQGKLQLENYLKQSTVKPKVAAPAAPSADGILSKEEQDLLNKYDTK